MGGGLYPGRFSLSQVVSGPAAFGCVLLGGMDCLGRPAALGWPPLSCRNDLFATPRPWEKNPRVGRRNRARPLLCPHTLRHPLKHRVNISEAVQVIPLQQPGSHRGLARVSACSTRITPTDG